MYGWTPNGQGRFDEITNTWRDVKRGKFKRLHVEEHRVPPKRDEKKYLRIFKSASRATRKSVKVGFIPGNNWISGGSLSRGYRSWRISSLKINDHGIRINKIPRQHRRGWNLLDRASRISIVRFRLTYLGGAASGWRIKNGNVGDRKGFRFRRSTNITLSWSLALVTDDGNVPTVCSSLLAKWRTTGNFGNVEEIGGYAIADGCFAQRHVRNETFERYAGPLVQQNGDNFCCWLRDGISGKPNCSGSNSNWGLTGGTIHVQNNTIGTRRLPFWASVTCIEAFVIDWVSCITCERSGKIPHLKLSSGNGIYGRKSQNLFNFRRISVNVRVTLRRVITQLLHFNSDEVYVDYSSQKNIWHLSFFIGKHPYLEGEISLQNWGWKTRPPQYLGKYAL